MTSESTVKKRRNLVVVRAGRRSLHPAWLNMTGDRNWDLVVSIYDAEAAFDHTSDITVVYQKGGKWDGLNTFFDSNDILERYEYVWLPDDDIATDGGSINRLFDLMQQHKLAVAQPSLTRNSYYSHFAFLNCPGFSLRFSNFIEIMVPCLRADLLKQLVADFAGSMSGYGLDYIWCRLSEDNWYKAAIIDDVVVHHTRPIGKVLRQNMSQNGIVAEEEETQLRSIYNVEGRIRPVIYAALDRRQRQVFGIKKLGWLMAFRYFGRYKEFTVQESPNWKIIQLVRRQMTRKPILSQLKRRT
jgi:hypothetical protein